MNLNDRRLKLTPKRIEALAALGIHTAEELLSYYPFRYEVMNSVPYQQWSLREHVVFEGEVVSAPRSFRRGRLVTTSFEVMAYETVLRITIFNRPWASRLAYGQRITIQGIYMGNAKVTATTYDTKPLAAHPAVTPVYSVREGVQQRTVRACISRVFEECQNEIHDIVPETLIRRYRLLRRGEAIRRVHFPQSMEDVRQGFRTLKYEEFLLFFVAVELRKAENSSGIRKPPKLFDGRKVMEAEKALGYELTADQKQVLHEILDDLGSEKVMYRLVQGDVGSGKTAVAALAMYAAVLSGSQAALLAPTEILARQHASSVHALLDRFHVSTVVLYSGMPAKEKEETIRKIESGEAEIVIGTHALLQDQVHFARLGLVVADEQQRFGVAQRRSLREKGTLCDFLLMSATPIPRTLASAVFGDMDVSTIETMPPGRQKPETVYIRENSFRSVLKQVKDLLDEGRQLYVICAAVEKNEDYNARNVYDVADQMTKLFPSYRTGILHGRMSSEEKQKAMQDFADNRTQILVSTTVVEVGMNVVNATGMIVYDADRFGLSQLHQLRGRIQRGSARGHCWLLSGSKDEKTQERLNVLVKSCNGFEISYEDLRLRGPGDILGTRQSGLPDFLAGNLITDTAIINTARKDAAAVAEDPENPAYGAVIGISRSRNTAYTD